MRMSSEQLHPWRREKSISYYSDLLSSVRVSVHAYIILWWSSGCFHTVKHAIVEILYWAIYSCCKPSRKKAEAAPQLRGTRPLRNILCGYVLMHLYSSRPWHTSCDLTKLNDLSALFLTKSDSIDANFMLFQKLNSQQMLLAIMYCNNVYTTVYVSKQYNNYSNGT